MDGDYQFTYSISAIKTLEQYTADIFIMSVDGIDVKKEFLHIIIGRLKYAG